MPQPVPTAQSEPFGEIAPTSTGSRIYINATATRKLVGSTNFRSNVIIATLEAHSHRKVGRHRLMMRAAIDLEADAQRAALAGDLALSESAFLEASDAYRRSWEAAPPRSYGRLVGMLKAAILGGRSTEAAHYVQRSLPEAPEKSPTAAYAAAIAALALDQDERAQAYAQAMRTGPDAFGRAASAIEGLASGDQARYRAALGDIVADFAARQAHLTGVAMADTAAMLERIAGARGMAAGLESPLLPPPAGGTSCE
ncbi:MAG TPA: hypothetical protein VIX82_18620 [Solirubrobacteraceae bacterium]